ncbi:MAG: hypothetical protein WB440_15915 [Steroidobacteraceae bacterium]|jgi:hypothetical protein
MRFTLKSLGLLFVLLSAQEGAVVHELTHLPGHAADLRGSEVRLQAGAAADTACALCPLFDQASTPAFSHAFQVPRLLRADLARSPEHADAATDAAVPTPRSRGPPSHS